RVVWRRVFDSLASEIDSNPGVDPTHRLDPFRRDEHVVAAPPVARVDNQIANRPRVIVNEQIVQVAYVTVCGLDVITDDSPATAQVAVIPHRRGPSPVELDVLFDPALGTQAARVGAHAPQARAAP